MNKIQHPKCSSQIETLLNRGAALHFLNTTIIPSGADGAWLVEEVTVPFIRHCLLYLGHAGQVDFAVSHIGHEATAQVASELFGQPLPMDRTPWAGDGLGVAIQLKGRLPEGQILQREELEKIGYAVRVVFRAIPQQPEPAGNPELAELATRLRNIANRVDRCGCGDFTSLVEVGEDPAEQGRSRFVTCQSIADLLNHGDALKDLAGRVGAIENTVRVPGGLP